MPRRVLDLPNGDFELLATAAEEIAVQRRSVAELASADLSSAKAAGEDIRTRAVRLTEILGEAGRLSVAAAALRGAPLAEQLYPPAPLVSSPPSAFPSGAVATAAAVPTLPASVMAEAATLADDPEVLEEFLRAAVHQVQRSSALNGALDAVNAAAGIANTPPPPRAKRRPRKAATPSTPSTPPVQPPRDEELARQALAAGAPDPEGEAAAAEPLSEAAAATLANLRAAAASVEVDPTYVDSVLDPDEDPDAGTDEGTDEVEEQGGGS